MSCFLLFKVTLKGITTEKFEISFRCYLKNCNDWKFSKSGVSKVIEETPNGRWAIHSVINVEKDVTKCLSPSKMC